MPGKQRTSYYYIIIILLKMNRVPESALIAVLAPLSPLLWMSLGSTEDQLTPTPSWNFLGLLSM